MTPENDEKSSITSDQTSDLQEKKINWWAVSLVTIITLARIGHGLFISITGPTLLFLAENTNSAVSAVSAMFTGRSGGILLGSFVFSGIMNRFPKFKPLVSLSLVLSINGIVMLVTPWCTDLWLLIIVTTIGGISFGYIDCGLQAEYLKLWGEEASRPYIQSFHFGFSIGAFLAPVLAAPFLQMASEDSDNEPNCPGKDTFTTVAPFMNYTDFTVTSDAGPTYSINPISWPFVIIGVYIIVIAVGMLVLSLMKIESKLVSTHSESVEKRPEEPLRNLYPFFTPIVGYYICCVASETVFQSYIYSMAICSDLQFTTTQASLLNTLFWAGFGIGRGTGIIHSNYFDPQTIIIWDLVGTTVGMVIMCIWGEYIAVITWIIAFAHGLFVATLYSSGVSWSSRETNMAGSYMVVFSLGNAMGGMGLVPAGGAIFDNEPFNVVYLVLGSCAFNAIFFAGMVYFARKRHVAVAIKEDTKDSFYTNKAYTESITKM